jgi:hypothetical protein
MQYTISGFIEFGIPNDILKKIEVGDSIIDLDGKGRRVSVNECSGCGKKLFSCMIYFTPIFCDQCALLNYSETRKTNHEIVH